MSNTPRSGNRSLTLAGREIHASLTSPLAYVFTGLFIVVAVTTFFLVERFFASDQASARGFFRWMPALLALVAPALTMRSWADERKLGSYELLVTLPLPSGQLVLGKFLGALAVLAMALVFTLGIPFTAASYGDLDWGPVLGGYTGSLLLGAAFLAIGLFCSSLVQDQMLALFLGWALCALTLLPDAPFWESLLPENIAGAFKHVGFGGRFDAVERGLLDLGDLVFYAAATVWFLALNTVVLEWRHGRDRFNLALLPGLLLLNFACTTHLVDSLHLWRADLTEGKHYSISAATTELMADLAEGGEITFYYSALENQHEKLRPLIDPLKDLLGEFAQASGGRVKVRAVELDKAGEKEQSEAESAYGVRPFPIPVRDAFQSGYRSTYFSVVVNSGTDFEHLNLESLIKVVERGGTDWEVELGDVEFLTARALKKLARGFGSVPGALVARDKRAKATVLLTADDTLPEHMKGLRETLTKVGARLQRESGGRFTLELKDPWKDKGPEERKGVDAELRRKYRISTIPKDLLSEDGFHSWVLLDVDGNEQVMPLYSSQAALGEADVKGALEGALKQLIPGFLSVVGFASPKADADPMMAQFGQRPPPDEFAAVQQLLSDEYEVRRIDLAGENPEIPRELSVLVLARPKALNQQALYQLDQFLMRGGRLIILADNHVLDSEGTGRSGSIQVAPVDTKSLQPLLAHYGVVLGSELLLDEQCDYLPLLKTRSVGRERVRYIEDVLYPFFVRVGPDGMDQQSSVTAQLAMSGMFWASPLSLGKLPEGAVGTELMHSSAKSGTQADASDVDSVLERGWKAAENAKPQVLALQVTGQFKSYFADKAIPGVDKPLDSADPAAAPTAARRGAPIAESQKACSLVVFGDSDAFSPVVFRAFQQQETVFESNFRLITNAIDQGGPDAELMPLRNRAAVRRPLTGLAGLSPDERASAAEMSFVWTIVWSVMGLLTVALLWWVRRRSQKPVELI